MAQIYRQVGSLTQLIDELAREGIGAFRTMDEIRSFRNNCRNSLNRIRERYREILRREVADLESKGRELSWRLDEKIQERDYCLRNELRELRGMLAGDEERNMLLRWVFFFRKKRLTKRKKLLENSFDEESRRPFGKEFAEINDIRVQIEDRKNNAEDWIERYSARDIEKEKRSLGVLRKHKYLFYGAEGEERVTRALSELPDTFTVINDYWLEFSQPIYDRNNNDRILSIQIDHLVVGPTGLYLVETKNWSQDSVGNPELFSPIKQLRRNNFAIFVLLNQAVERGEIDNFSNHWGNQRVSPKNILCLINHRPNLEFQYVRMLSERQIVRYVRNQRQTFSQLEVNSLTENLLSRIA